MIEPELRDSLELGPYRIEVWECGPAYFRVRVLREDRDIRGPYRSTHLDAAVAWEKELAARLREYLHLP